MTEPTALPSARPGDPSTAARTDTAASGAVVPRLTMVAPTTIGGIRRLSESSTALSTRTSAALPRTSSDTAMPARRTDQWTWEKNCDSASSIPSVKSSEILDISPRGMPTGFRTIRAGKSEPEKSSLVGRACRGGLLRWSPWRHACRWPARTAWSTSKRTCGLSWPKTASLATARRRPASSQTCALTAGRACWPVGIQARPWCRETPLPACCSGPFAVRPRR